MHEHVFLLNLRMNGMKRKQLPNFQEDLDSCLDALAIMTSQDSVYKCRDYLGRRKAMQSSERSSRCVASFQPCQDTPDMVCREKMVEWSYRVCDHFHTNREIVAFAFSFLDRFIDRCSCDRTAFKLASMTSLYMAMKVFNSKQISITSLADLSRGEFDVHHISEMEKIILETLDWRLNPPTAQSLIDRLCRLIPLEDEVAVKAIYERSTFLAEICIYDYELVTEERYLIAVACILNAMEGMEEDHLCRTLPLQFIASLRSHLCVDLNPCALEHCQERIWSLYSCSEQLQHDDILPHHIRYHQAEGKSFSVRNHSVSPISVDEPY